VIAWLSAVAAAGALADSYVCPSGRAHDDCCAGLPRGRTCHDSIAAALADTPPGGVIELAPGTYPDAVSIAQDVTIRGRARAPILSTTDPKARAVVDISADATVVLDGLLLTSGATRAIEARFGADLTIRDSTLLSSGPRDFGGAIHAEDAVVRVESSLVEGGTAESRGGQLHATASRVVLVDTQLHRGTAVRDGGAVYLDAGSDLVAEGCLFSSHRAYRDGGAVAVVEGASATFVGTTFVDDEAFRDGGAVWAGPGASVELRDTSLVNNSAGRSGGAVAVDGGTLALDRSELSLNRALGASGSGGALWLRVTDPTTDLSFANLRLVENAEIGRAHV
jgi:hypothetical protein